MNGLAFGFVEDDLLNGDIEVITAVCKNLSFNDKF
jgi:hypothetical protein